MTAVEAPRAPVTDRSPGTPGAVRAPTGSRPRRPPQFWVAVVVVLVCTLVAGLLAAGAAFSSTGRYQSTASIVFNNTLPMDENISNGSRYVQERLSTWERVGSSQAVPDRAAVIGSTTGGATFDPTAVSVEARYPTGTELLEVTATSNDGTTIAGDATTAAQALVDVVVQSERLPGTPDSKVVGSIVSPGGPVVDHGMEQARWWGIVGAVAGFLVSFLACSLLRPGGWARGLAPHTVRSRRRMVELNSAVMGDELRGLLRGLRTPAGKATVVLVAVSIAGYAVTASMVFPLLPVLAAAVWTWRTADPRWSAAALLFTAVGVFPDRVNIVRIGPVTPTVLELALVLALALSLRGRGVGRLPRSAFTVPVLLLVAAATIGAIWAIASGGGFTLMIDNYRALLVVLAFFPIWFAFARRPHQLVATLLAIAGVSSTIVLAAATLGVNNLLVDERTSVITGAATSDVSRLSGPTLNLWAPLLILLLSALMPRQPRWLWGGLVLVGVLHQAASFNRSTWVPLILLIVAVAAVTHGPKGLARRAAVLAVVGSLGLTVALTGVAGGQAQAIAERATSVVTGQAYGEDSLPDRMRENIAAYDTLEQQPWMGVGVGQYYGGELPTYDDVHSRLVVDPRPYIHNQYLRIWLFMGVIGLFAFAFMAVRVLSLTLTSWRRRLPGAPMVVVVAMGLSCLAAQASLQTTLVDRPAIVTTVALLAAAAAFATWTPWTTSTGGSAPVTGAGGGAPSRSAAPGTPAPPEPAPHSFATQRSARPGDAPRRPTAGAGTMEE